MNGGLCPHPINIMTTELFYYRNNAHGFSKSHERYFMCLYYNSKRVSVSHNS